MPQQPPEPPNRKRPSLHDRRYPELERDRGMARTTIATRWIAAGGLAGVAVFAGLAAASTHHASADPTTPAATDAPAPDTAPSTTPATTSVPSVATTGRATAPAPSPAASAAPSTAATRPPTTPATVAPAQIAPAPVPKTRHRSPVVTSGSS